jgi:hypothetical protein
MPRSINPRLIPEFQLLTLMNLRKQLLEIENTIIKLRTEIINSNGNVRTAIINAKNVIKILVNYNKKLQILIITLPTSEDIDLSQVIANISRIRNNIKTISTRYPSINSGNINTLLNNNIYNINVSNAYNSVNRVIEILQSTLPPPLPPPPPLLTLPPPPPPSPPPPSPPSLSPLLLSPREPGLTRQRALGRNSPTIFLPPDFLQANLDRSPAHPSRVQSPRHSSASSSTSSSDHEDGGFGFGLKYRKKRSNKRANYTKNYTKRRETRSSKMKKRATKARRTRLL